MPGLSKDLGTWQILFITIGGTIGLGFATTTGEVLAISGPGGVLLAFGIVGVVAICVMEGICDMIVILPISNAMIEFVRAFVDPDLAIVVGFAYWYTYCINLAALIIGTVNLFKYWDISFPIQNVLYIVFLLAILLINSRGVKLFGWIELVAGVFKIALMFVIFVIMMCINHGSIGKAGPIRSTFFNDGFRNNPNVANSYFTAILASIPVAIFSYIGIEVIAVTAFEAERPSRLKSPAKHIAYIIMGIYLVLIGGFVANIEWFNQSLPEFLGQPLVDIRNVALGHTPFAWPLEVNSRSKAAPVIAVLQVGVEVLPGILNGFIIYSGFSVANTVLYVASRTLYGLTRDIAHGSDNKIKSFLAIFNRVTPTTHVPGWSLLASLIVFAIWLPFLHLNSSFTQTQMQQVLVNIGSVGCLLVWASQCLAYIRYHWWLSDHSEMLTGEHMGRFNRWPQTGFSSYLSFTQPVPAYIGFVSCLGIVLALNSVSMWNRERLILKALTVYLGPGILLLIFIILKIINRRSYVKLGGWEELRETLTRLNDLVESEPHQSSSLNSVMDQPTNPSSHSIPPIHVNGGAIHPNPDSSLPQPVHMNSPGVQPNNSNSGHFPIPQQYQSHDQAPYVENTGSAYEMRSLSEPVSPRSDVRSGSIALSASNGAEGSYRDELLMARMNTPVEAGGEEVERSSRDYRRSGDNRR